MAHRVVAAVFASQAAAEQAMTCLIAAGVAEDRIGISVDLTTDGIAAEMPGQSFANQPGQGGAVDETEIYADAARGGVCVVRVDLGPSNDYASIDRIMRECGAQRTTHPG